MATKKSIGYKVDFTSKTLTMTKAFEEKAQNPESKEFAILMNLQNSIPGLIVERKTHATPRTYTNKQGEKFNCNQFKNLTLDNMKAFIEGLPNSEKFMKSYNFLRYYGSLPLTSRYTAVRKWFVAQFPEFRKNPLFYLSNEAQVVDIAPFIQEAQERAEEQEKKEAQETSDKPVEQEAEKEDEEQTNKVSGF